MARRNADRLAGAGATTAEEANQLEVSERTLQRWFAQFSGMKAVGAERLKELENESLRLKLIVANQTLDLDVMRAATPGSF
jgi:transposase